MVKGGTGGGNTITGLIYEGKVDLPTYLSQQKGYEVKGPDVYYNGNLVAHVFKKQGFYKFLEDRSIVWSKY